MLGCEEITAIFESLFRQSHNIVLIGGAEEPVYLPAENDLPNRLYYTRDYPASALHEIAHWCLARSEQLSLKDWGLWYVPDGRNASQQESFQQAEARVQAIEWILSVAAGRQFRESTDNLGGEATNDAEFKNAIHRNVVRFCKTALPERAQQMFDALLQHRKVSLDLNAELFDRQALDGLRGTVAA